MDTPVKSSKQHKNDKKEKKGSKDRENTKDRKDSKDKDRDTAGEPLSKKQAKLLKKLEKMSPEEQAAYKEAALLARKVMYKGRKVKASLPRIAKLSSLKSEAASSAGTWSLWCLLATGQHCLSTSAFETGNTCLACF